MTYLVFDGDRYTLHHADGTQIGTGWDDRPDTSQMADAVAEAYTGLSLLGEPMARQAFVDVTAGGLNYRDLSIEGESVPWQ